MKRIRREILSDADTAVCGDREETHGDVSTSFKKIADIWSVRLGVRIEPHMVAIMMIDVKTIRIERDPEHLDHFVDICGYGAIAGEVANASK